MVSKHACCPCEGWAEGVTLLLSLGAKVNASNNAGDRPWHWARNMNHTDVMDLLERVLAKSNSEHAL
jgi:ankyrin repeat protein